MQQAPFLVLPASSSLSPVMRDLQVRIGDLYQQLSELEPKSDSKAHELIRAIRRLEMELIGMAMAQPSCYLRM